MNKQDKDLLIKDLCARLPYGVGGRDCYFDEPYSSEVVTGFIEEDGDYKVHYADENYIFIKDFKPILFPLSAINQEIEVNGEKLVTREKLNESINFLDYRMESEGDFEVNAGYVFLRDCYFVLDFFHRYHIDYRGLINKGLAISVFDLPENPYK